jgi:hypothetical protein
MYRVNRDLCNHTIQVQRGYRKEVVQGKVHTREKLSPKALLMVACIWVELLRPHAKLAQSFEAADRLG